MWANNTHSKKLPIPTPGNMWPVVIPGQGRLMLKRETPVLLGNHAPKSNNPWPPNIHLLYDIDTFHMTLTLESGFRDSLGTFLEGLLILEIKNN